MIDPGHSPGFELGANYALQQSSYNVSVNWMHIGTSDSSSKQASENTDITTVEFVAPPYDVGPSVFGIKRADSTVTTNFNQISMDFGKLIDCGNQITVRIFTGISMLNISQNLKTTFSDYAGSPIVPGQAYALPADPRYYFTTKNTSDYLGFGPNIGVNLQYQNANGLGIVGQFSGSLTAGSISANDAFTSASARLFALGIDPSKQSITAPNSTQLVPGFDSKLGLFYGHTWRDIALTIEGGYRFAYFVNAIETISPDTLV